MASDNPGLPKMTVNGWLVGYIIIDVTYVTVTIVELLLLQQCVLSSKFLDYLFGL